MNVRRLVPFFFLIASLCASAAWACSGPGAMARIEAAERLGWWLFGINAALVAAGMLLLRMRGRSLRQTGWLLAFAAIHPGWWLSARGGDCGAMRSIGSWACLGLSALLLTVLILFSRKREKGGDR
jgi:hypothetical protein